MDTPTDVPRKVLLVEEHSIVYAALHSVFERAGWRVVGARDGAEALRLAGEERPDAIVCDYALPDQTGLDFLRALRRQAPPGVPPFALLVGHATPELEAECRRLGAADCIPKQLEVEAFVERLYAALGINGAAH